MRDVPLDKATKLHWRVGDWCFFEFQLSQVQREAIGEVREVSDGMFCTSGRLTDRCLPLSLKAANLSQHARHWSDRLHKEGHAGLNYPDIHSRLVDLWLAACIAPEGEETTAAAEALSKFAQAVLDACNEPRMVDGVVLMRQRA